MSIIICDLDGTLSDPSHRRHLVISPTRDYAAFDDLCLDDPPNLPVLEILHRFQDHSLAIFSGRTGRPSVVAKTERWLARYRVYPHIMHLRTPGDNTPDEVLKENWYYRYIHNRHTVLFVLDDRTKVVRMWRQLNLPCFQVNHGDF